MKYTKTQKNNANVDHTKLIEFGRLLIYHLKFNLSLNLQICLIDMIRFTRKIYFLHQNSHLYSFYITTRETCFTSSMIHPITEIFVGQRYTIIQFVD